MARTRKAKAKAGVVKKQVRGKRAKALPAPRPSLVDGARETRGRLDQMGALGERFAAAGWRPAREVLVPVRAVPTIFPSVDLVTRVGGWPTDRIVLMHGPSNEGKSAMCHGLGLSFLKRGHAYAYIDAEYCYDSETEVLTRRGFVRWHDLLDGEQVGCWDSEADSLVYEVPLGVTRSKYSGRMYRVDHSGVDLLVTAKHKMYVQLLRDSGHARGASLTNGGRKIEWGSWELVRACDLDNRRTVRYRKHAARRLADDAELAGYPLHEDSRSLLRLIGFFIGDGWVGKDRGRTDGICFTLKKQRKVSYLREVCLEVGWPLDEMANNTFVVRAEGVGRLFREHFYDENGDKRIPDHLLDLNENDAKAVLDGLRNSDGTRKRGAWEYSTSSGQVAHAVQRLVLHAGGSAHIGRNEVVYRVMVLSRMLEPIVNDKRDNTSWVDYDGEIHCAHTRTGVLVVRRNGKIVLSGNTTPEAWVQGLMREFASHPGFRALRPRTYEETVEAVEAFCTAIGEAKAKRLVDPETTALLVVDSLRKLVPKRLLEIMLKEDAAADEAKGAGGRKKKPGGVDGMSGRAAQYKAALNAAWMDRLVPLLGQTGCGMILIAREYDDPEAAANPFSSRDWKVGGGKSPYYDSSLVVRVTRDGYVQERNEKGPPTIYGERHCVEVHKTKIGPKEEKVPEAFFHTSNGHVGPVGFDLARDLVEVARERGLLTERGSHLWLGGERLGNGVHNAVQRMYDDAALLAEVEEAVRAEVAASMAADAVARGEDGPGAKGPEALPSEDA